MIAATGIVLAAACGITGTDDARIQIRDHAAAVLPRSAMSITLTAPGFQRKLTPDEMAGADIVTPSTGSITVSYVLRDPSGTTDVSTGSVLLGLRRDQVIGVDIAIDSASPARVCFGCAGSKAFPLAAAYRRTAADSLWVTWGSNSISDLSSTDCPGRRPYEITTPHDHSRNPLHGITLERMLTELVERMGWEQMGRRIPIRCFTSDPSIKSSLAFLRRTPWARAKVEALYLGMIRK